MKGYASGKIQVPAREYDRWLRSDAYNRSNQLNGIQDIITAISSIRDAYPDESFTVVGLGKSGLLTLFAAAVHGGADRVVVDFNHTDPGYDGELVNLLPVTSIRKIGDVRTAILLLSARKLTIFNVGQTFNIEWYKNKINLLDLENNIEFVSDESSVSFVNLK